MLLIKRNVQKKRVVYKLDSGDYKKVWEFSDKKWLDNHVALLNKVVPDYILEHDADEKSMWMIARGISGVPVSTLPHNDTLIREVYEYCLTNIFSTAPYFHGDWVLSNIIYNNGTMQMCDWDNLNIYPLDQVIKKLHKDLESAFGIRYKEIVDVTKSIQLPNFSK